MVILRVQVTRRVIVERVIMSRTNEGDQMEMGNKDLEISIATAILVSHRTWTWFTRGGIS